MMPKEVGVLPYCLLFLDTCVHPSVSDIGGCIVQCICVRQVLSDMQDSRDWREERRDGEIKKAILIPVVCERAPKCCVIILNNAYHASTPRYRSITSSDKGCRDRLMPRVNISREDARGMSSEQLGRSRTSNLHFTLALRRRPDLDAHHLGCLSLFDKASKPQVTYHWCSQCGSLRSCIVRTLGYLSSL